MINRLGTQSKSIAMEKSGKGFPVAEKSHIRSRRKDIYRCCACRDKGEPASHSFDIYISGGGVGNIEFCKKLSKTITINGDMYEDDFSSMS